MSSATEVLLLYCAWTLALAVVYVGYRVALVLTFKEKANAWTRNAPTHVDPAWVLRVNHAHLNCLETLPLYAGIVLGAYASGQLSAIDGLAYVFLGARIAQSIVHLISTGPMFVFLRANALIVQWALMAYWLFALLQ